MEIHQIIFFALLTFACCYAVARGGAPERLTAVGMVCALVITLTLTLVNPRPSGAYSTVELGVALADFVLFLEVVAIALVGTRFWPIVMGSMMGCGLFGHLTKPLGPDILPRAYYIAVAVWSYPELILLLAATWRHRVRMARYGVDHAWIWQLPRRNREDGSANKLPRPTVQR